MKGVLVAVAVLVASLSGAFFGFVKTHPLPAAPVLGSSVVVAADGAPLYVKPGKDGNWDYPVVARQVSPFLIQALTTTQDPDFRHNLGIRPLALARALWNRFVNGRSASASTLTLKVVNLIEPHGDGLGARLVQVLRALQLTLHDSKQQILDLYLNLAPYGGPLRGVQAASYAYFGIPASRLDRAQAALLAALPDAPTRLRPDLHPRAARRARDRVLAHMAASGTWTRFAVAQARQSPLTVHYDPLPRKAPLLGRRLVQRDAVKGRRPALIHTTIDSTLQAKVNALFKDLGKRLPPATSAAVLVMDNRSLAVRAYRGSAAYPQRGHFAFVDMADKRRPIGRTLTPLVYGLAMDAHLIDSASLLADVPRAFGEYIPAASGSRFLGPISAAGALKRGLRIPAVQVLVHLGPQVFVSRLRGAGIPLELTTVTASDPSLLDSGVETTLTGLVRAYSALGRGGVAGEPRLTPGAARRQKRLLSPGAAWILRHMLAARQPPQVSGNYPTLSADHRLAWARGHSGGGRDLWAVGLSGQYTIGVWIGRPDGTAIPPYYKRIPPLPVLFRIASDLPDAGGWPPAAYRPASVKQKTVCWPLGLPPDPAYPAFCQRRLKAFTLNGVTPPTLRAPNSPRPQAIVQFAVNPQTGKRVNAKCAAAQREPRALAQWPLMLTPWLPRIWLKAATPPSWDASCPHEPPPAGDTIHITGVPPHDHVKLSAHGPASFFVLGATGGKGVLFWMVDGQLIWTTGPNEAFSYRITGPGTYTVTVMDARGANAQVTLTASRG